MGRWPKRRQLEGAYCDEECSLGNETVKEIKAHVEETGHTVIRVWITHEYFDPESFAEVTGRRVKTRRPVLSRVIETAQQG